MHKTATTAYDAAGNMIAGPAGNATPILMRRDSDNTGTFDQTSYYLTDANHNVTALVDASGTVIERYSYSPYGQATIYHGDFSTPAYNLPSYGNNFLFQGQFLDPETGNFYDRERYDDPNLGTFLSRDPSGYGGGANVEGFESESPIDRTDAAGLDPQGGAPIERKNLVQWTVDYFLSVSSQGLASANYNTPIAPGSATGSANSYSWESGNQLGYWAGVAAGPGLIGNWISSKTGPGNFNDGVDANAQGVLNVTDGALFYLFEDSREKINFWADKSGNGGVARAAGTRDLPSKAQMQRAYSEAELLRLRERLFQLPPPPDNWGAALLRAQNPGNQRGNCSVLTL